MNQDIFKEILPNDYIERFLNNSIRSDGRQFLEKRQIQINLESTGKQNPYILVRIGNTLMTSTFQTKIEEIKTDMLLNIQDKQVQIQLDLGYFQESDMTNMEKKKMESYYQQYLEQLFEQNYSDLKQSLNCEQEAKNHQWKIQINLNVLNNDGNIFDSLILGTQLILHNVTLPKIEKLTEDSKLSIENNKKKQEFYINENIRHKIRLNKDNFLLPKTYCLLTKDILVLDPNEYEERHGQLVLSILIPLFQQKQNQNEDYNVIFHKFGSSTDVSLDLLQKIYNLSIQNIKDQEQLYSNILEGKSQETQYL